jgi:hypothetical protein
MRSGINLTLLIGPLVPAPVPRVVLDALTDVEVTVAAGSASGFQLRFALSNRSPLHTLFLLSGGALPPVIRVVIVATVRGRPEVLIDGVMTEHQVTPGGEAGQAILSVTGEDLTRVMDFVNFDGFPYPAMPAEARVAVICAKYAAFGIVPQVIPSVFLDVPIPTDRIPRHQGTDLAYVKQLADCVGYSFYLEAGPSPGTSLAYWGPEVRLGVPQPALNLDMDASSNVESLDFTFDNTSAELPVVLIQNPITKTPIPIPLPAVNPLSPPLGLIPPLPNRVRPVKATGKLTAIQATALALARAARTSDAVTGTGSLDVSRYGRVLKARQLVGVRGAGTAFDGLYYVRSVTHRIRRGEFKQSFTLVRNGLVSTLPRVPA